MEKIKSDQQTNERLQLDRRPLYAFSYSTIADEHSAWRTFQFSACACKHRQADAPCAIGNFRLYKYWSHAHPHSLYLMPSPLASSGSDAEPPNDDLQCEISKQKPVSISVVICSKQLQAGTPHFTLLQVSSMHITGVCTLGMVLSYCLWRHFCTEYRLWYQRPHASSVYTSLYMFTSFCHRAFSGEQSKMAWKSWQRSRAVSKCQGDRGTASYGYQQEKMQGAI